MSRPDKNIARLTGVGKTLVPVDGTPFPESDAFYCGVTGDLEAIFRDDGGSSVTLVGVAAGIWHPMKLVQVVSFTGSGAVIGWSSVK